MNATSQPTHGHCCCERFLDEHGNQRTQAHACCPRHWREADDAHR